MTTLNIFLAAFVGNLTAFALVGAIVLFIVRRDIRRAQKSVEIEMERGRDVLAAFLSANESASETDKSKLN